MATRGKTKENLQKAAIKLFSQSGYYGVSTKEIARAAETTEVTLFRHFPTKAALYDSLVARFWKTPSMQYLELGSYSGQWHTDLKRFSGLMHQACSNNAQILEMLLKDDRIESLTPWKDFTSEMGQRLCDYLDQHWKTGGKISSRELSECICNGLIGLSLRHSLKPFLAQDQDFTLQADLMISAFYYWVQHQD